MAKEGWGEAEGWDGIAERGGQGVGSPVMVDGGSRGSGSGGLEKDGVERIEGEK